MDGHPIPPTNSREELEGSINQDAGLSIEDTNARYIELTQIMEGIAPIDSLPYSIKLDVLLANIADRQAFLERVSGESLLSTLNTVFRIIERAHGKITRMCNLAHKRAEDTTFSFKVLVDLVAEEAEMVCHATNSAELINMVRSNIAITAGASSAESYEVIAKYLESVSCPDAGVYRGALTEYLELFH